MSLIFPLRKRGIKRTKTGFAFARFPTSSTQSIEGKRGVLEFAAVEVNVNRLRILSPVASDAHELAQQIAGAVESMDSKECRVSNFSGHGTGGGYSETRFDCGAKGFEVMTVEPMGTKERYTPELKMTIGEMPRAN